ncbi:hypothetical protein GQ53DRAFT_766442 [Thozetella sp. PMI_491]|nr:hypothetical protein GQ53DRAFT_766442 [Thozetella sp. PMI_491]
MQGHKCPALEPLSPLPPTKQRSGWLAVARLAVARLAAPRPALPVRARHSPGVPRYRYDPHPPEDNTAASPPSESDTGKKGEKSIYSAASLYTEPDVYILSTLFLINMFGERSRARLAKVIMHHLFTATGKALCRAEATSQAKLVQL